MRRRALLAAVTAALGVVVPLGGPGAVGAPPAARWPVRFRAMAELAAGERVAGLDAVACVSEVRCVAVGAATSGAALLASGTEAEGRWRWTAPRALAPGPVRPDVLTAVACPTPSTCLAVGYGTDGAGGATATTGTALSATATLVAGRWRTTAPRALPTGSPSAVRLGGLACPTSATCVAVGEDPADGDGVVAWATDRSGAWRFAPPVAVAAPAGGGGALRAVACPTATVCVAVGDGAPGVGVTTAIDVRGAAWQPAGEVALPAGGPALDGLGAVACPTADACVAAASTPTGSALATGAPRAGTWTFSPAGVLAPVGAAGIALACPTRSRCVALAAAASGAAWLTAPGAVDSDAWSAPVRIGEGTSDHGLAGALACPSALGCVAVGVDDDARAVAAATVGAPGVPRAVLALARPHGALVRWVAPAFDGGAPIGSYRATATPGGQHCAALARAGANGACTLSGLVDERAYRVTVTADNGAGVSAPSAPSRRVVPSLFQPPIRSPLAGAVARDAASCPSAVTVAVEDLATGQRFALAPGVAQRTASIVKVDILADLLDEEEVAHASMPPAVRELATEMIEASDNDAAQDLFVRIGQAPALQAFDDRLGLRGTHVSWAWGETTTTATDQTRVLDLFSHPNAVLDTASRAFGLSLLRHVEPEQAWGVSSGPGTRALVALKNGWYPEAPGDWQVNSIGWIVGSGRDYELAVLTDEDATMSTGVTCIEGISSRVWSALGHPRRAGGHEAGQSRRSTERTLP